MLKPSKEQRDKLPTADMSAAPAMVIKRGKIFEAGDYPTQQFSLTPEEMLAAVASFAPVPVWDTHMARETSLLDGKLGQVQSIALDPANPYDLIGEVAIPQWLDDALQGTEISVSAEWNRETKQLAGLALLTNPQVEDAAIFAAFAKAQHNTPTGQSTMQMLHDDAARAGAICTPPADFASKHEATATQQIHDITTEHGATCASGSKPAWYSANPVSFSKKESRMSFGERFKTWFTGGMVGDLPLADEAAVAAPATFAAVPATAPDPEIVALKGEVARLKAERIEAGAQAFFAAEYAAHRAYPAERDEMLEEYRRAALDDAEHGLATFSGTEKTSRVEALTKRYAVRPAHALTTEQLKPEDVTALFNQMTTPQAGAEKPITPERHDALMAMTELGRASLNGANKN